MSITSANATIWLTVNSVFPVAQQIQGFAADDVFDSESQAISEVLMGVDGKLSGGFVYVPFKWKISIQADSPSGIVFDSWATAQRVAQDTFSASATVSFNALGTKFAMINGFLTGYKAMPDAKKLLQPRQFEITWESVLPAPV